MSGNLQTVAFMQRIGNLKAGDPLLQRLARQIVLEAGVPSHFYADESFAIGQFVQSQVRYSRDPEGYEQLQDPALMVADIQNGQAQGDCDDMALLTATLLLAIGHTPYFRVVRYTDDGTNKSPFEHIYVVDYEANQGGDQQRIVIDCIIKDQPIGYEVRQASGQEIPA